MNKSDVYIPAPGNIIKVELNTGKIYSGIYKYAENTINGQFIYFICKYQDDKLYYNSREHVLNINKISLADSTTCKVIEDLLYKENKKLNKNQLVLQPIIKQGDIVTNINRSRIGIFDKHKNGKNYYFAITDYNKSSLELNKSDHESFYELSFANEQEITKLKTLLINNNLIYVNTSPYITSLWRPNTQGDIFVVESIWNDKYEKYICILKKDLSNEIYGEINIPCSVYIDINNKLNYNKYIHVNYYKYVIRHASEDDINLLFTALNKNNLTLEKNTHKIIKYKPETGNKYYYINICNECTVKEKFWCNDELDNELIRSNNLFINEESANNAVNEIKRILFNNFYGEI